MSNVATLIADMVRAGVDPDIIGRTAEALSKQPTSSVDEQAERRRAKDRERKRLRNSAESAESAEAPPSDKEKSPTPPKEINSPRETNRAREATPRDELQAVLDADRAKAVIDHRQRIRKPLTPRAAQLLASKFARCPDPNAAADAMIANGWQGFEPDWIERRGAGRGAPPPKPKSEFQQHQDDCQRELDIALGRIPKDEYAGHSFDLDQRDWRSH